jgi:hypothetical protein
MSANKRYGTQRGFVAGQVQESAMVVRPFLSAVVLAALTMTAGAAAPAAPAAHAVQSVRGKGGPLPHLRATVPGVAVSPKVVRPISGWGRPRARRSLADKAFGNLPSSSPAARRGLVRPLGPLVSGLHSRGTASSGFVIRNAGQINGTGMVRKGVGPSSIGASARPRYGINGTGMKRSGIRIR